jgi:hypothetical protein
VQIDTRSMPFDIGNPGGNSTAGSIVEPLPQLAIPGTTTTSGVTTAGDGIIAMAEQISQGGFGAMTANGLMLIPYGAGSATQTYTLKCYGWRRTLGKGETAAGLWVPFLLASFTVTLGTAPGIAGTDVNASQLFATTIALVTGNANVSNEIVSPGSNVIGHITLDAKGVQYIETRYAMVSATSGNCLVAKM